MTLPASMFAAHVAKHPGKAAAAAVHLLSSPEPPDVERGRLLAVALREADRCAVCGRPLFNEDSKRAGIGPECRGKGDDARNALSALRAAGFDVLDPVDLEEVS